MDYMTCPTVKIKTDAPDNELGYVVINESDFDPQRHERYEPAESKPEPKKAKRAAE